jgi:two-component system cell cycle sensor histidine kinase PleC
MSICDTLDDCHRLMRLRAENKGLELVEDFDPNLKTIWADERAIRQICLNLLTNAIKFTPRGGSVTMTARSEPDGGQTIIVTDTGPGIPKEEIPKVLSAFGQGSLAQKSAEGGTGLGLPIVSRLIELHGGRFELKSELRRGTQAIVRIPATRVLQPMGQMPEPASPPIRQTARQGAPARQPATCQTRSDMAVARHAAGSGQSPARRTSQGAAGRRPPRSFAPVRQRHRIDATETP